MTLDEIGRIVAAAERAGLQTLEAALHGCTLSLRGRGVPAPVAVPSPVPAAAAGVEAPASALKAPAAGVFRASHPAFPAEPPGHRRVAAGEAAGFLQVGPCLRPVVAPVAARIGPALVPDGELVGYGTPLFPLRDGVP